MKLLLFVLHEPERYIKWKRGVKFIEKAFQDMWDDNNISYAVTALFEVWVNAENTLVNYSSGISNH